MIILFRLTVNRHEIPVSLPVNMVNVPRIGERLEFRRIPEHAAGLPWVFMVTDVEYKIGDDDGYVIVVDAEVA